MFFRQENSRLPIEKYILKYVSLTISTVFSLLIVLIVLLNLIHTDDSVEISGKINPIMLEVYFSPFSGIVNQFYVKNGEYINSGDKILKFDKSELSRVLIEKKIKLIELLNDNRDFLEFQYKINDNYDTEIEKYEIQILDMKRSIEFLEKYKLNIDIRNQYSRFEIDQFINEKDELLSSINTLQISISELLNYKAYISQEIDNSKNEITQSKNQDLIQCYYTDAIVDLQKEIIQFEYYLKNLIVYSKCSGFIRVSLESDDNDYRMMILNNRDQVFKIMSSENYYISALVSDEDFPFINKNDKVYISINAYPIEEFGYIEGFVDEIFYTPNNASNEDEYKINIYFNELSKLLPIYDSMNVKLRIRVDKNLSLFKYLFKSIFKVNQTFDSDLYIIKRKIK